jgi:outer membrane protein assembly factor BamB
VADGVVYVGTYRGYVYALNASTGAKLWRRKMGCEVNAPPAVANGVVYVYAYLCGETSKLYALNARTGANLWSYPAQDSFSDSAPAVANGMVYMGAGGHVYAFGLR